MKPAIKGILIFVLICFSFLFFYKNILYSESDTPGILLERDPVDVAINPLTNEAIAVNEKSDSVSIVDLNSQTVLYTIPVGKFPRGVAVDNESNLALIGNSHDDNLSIIDLNTYEIISTVPVARQPQGIALDPLTSTALVANHKDDSVSVIDLMTYSVTGTIPVGKQPIDIAIDPELNLALVVNEKDDNLSVIDLNTFEVTGEVTVGKKPQAIDINPETHIAVVANKVDNTISIINLLTWESYDVPVEKHPVDIAINPLDNRALVICDVERKLLLIDLDTGTIVNEYLINKKSEAVAVNPYTNIAGVVDSKTDSLTLIQLPNPVPQMSSINPDTILRGSSDTLINIEGSRFLNSSLAYLDGQVLNTTFTDNHNIQAVIPEEMLSITGSFPVTVLNPAPEGGVSNSLNLQINNPVPSISALDPAEAIAGTASLTVNVQGTGFFDDTTVYVNNSSRPFTLLSQTMLQINLTASDLETGAYLEITASNPLPGGGLSASAVFTVLNPVPVLTSISPSSITAASPDFTLTLTGDNFVNTSVVSFNAQQFPITYINNTQIQADIPSGAVQTSGDYLVKVINPAPGGGESDSLTFTVTIPLEVLITSPSDGDVVDTSEIQVQGTAVSSYSITSVNVNGIEAALSGNSFTALITLITGPNTITALAFDSNGDTDSTSITVTYEPSVEPPSVTEESGYIDGYVFDARANLPLSNVSITVAGITGEISTDSQGFFSFPVSDFPLGIPGKEVILTAEKAGYTYGQRKVVVRPRLDVIVDNIYLVPRDTVTTTITPDGGIATNSRGNIILEFPAGAVDAPIEVNITELDSSKELPAPLPDTSLFTFAADFLPDGKVFIQPVHMKAENFLGFPAGTPVPVGYYDRDIGAWIPDGVGVISDDGLWMEYDLTHFSPLDLNWYGVCSAGGCQPPPRGGGEGDDGGCGENMCCVGSGPGGGEKDSPTLINIRDGSVETDHNSTSGYTVLGQDFNLTLRYNSKHAHPQVFIGRTADYSSFPYLPDILRADIDFMGMRKTGFFQPSFNELSFRAIFEPEDIRGNELPTGFYPYVVTLTNRYDTLYYTLTSEFGGYGSTVFSIPTREPKYVNRSFYREVFVRNDIDSHLAKGWSIDGVRKLIKSYNGRLAVIDGGTYEVFGGGLYEVTGENIISTVAGGGSGGDGGPATEAWLQEPIRVTVDKAGNIYIGDGSKRVRKVSLDGIITTVAGNGFGGYSGDNGPATEAAISIPKGIAVDSIGNIYIATTNHRIRKVDTNGIITTVAGTGQSGYNGDGIPATQAMLNSPEGTAVDDAGNIYISDDGNNRIRKVSASGIISTIAGNGYEGWGGDGGPATDATMISPRGVAVDGLGNIYFADVFLRCIRKVDINGIINTFAGYCSPFHSGNSGDGGFATDARFIHPSGLAVDNTGNLFISDSLSHRIRKVDTNGIINTVAGTGGTGFSGGGFSGDSGPASEALLKFPSGIAVDSAGSVYIADTGNSRIRKINISYDITLAGTVIKSSRNNGTTLTINGDSTYTMTYKDGFTVQFSSEGLQTSVVDKNGNITQYVYDAQGKLVQVIDPAGGVTVLNYSNDYLSSITDPQARQTTLNIDANGDLVSITAPDGNITSYIYDTSHRLISKTLPGNKTYSYTYDSHNMVSDVTLPDGNTKQYTHSIGLWLLNDIISTEDSPAPQVLTDTLFDEVVDEIGNTTIYRTNRHGLSIMKIDALGRITLTDRDKNSRPLIITQPDGSVIQKTYDEKGNLITETDALGNITTYTYEPEFNQVATITDPKGNVTTFSYDSNGNLISTTDPLGNVTSMTYDTRGLLTSSTDANGGVIQYQYNSKGNLIKTIDQLGNATTYTRDTAGNIISVTDAESNVTANEYDIMNRLTKVTDATGGITTYTYTSGGCPSGCGGGTTGDLLESITDANGNVTSFEYDERDRQIKIINPDGTFITKIYDAKGNLLSQTDENGNTTQYAYDAVVRLLSVTDPLGGITGYSYDTLDNLVSVADANSNTTTYEYDSAKRLLKTISPDTGITTYSYDTNGNLISKTDANGVTVNYSYDGLNRLTLISFPDPSDNVSYTYDTCLNGKGRLCGITDPAGTTSYEYNARGQTVKETKVIDGVTYITMYNYSSNGNLESIIYPDSRLVTYSYISNRIDSVVTTKDSITKTIVSNIAYDPVSLPLAISYGNGILTDMSYDTRNRLSNLLTQNSTLQTLNSFIYTRDNTGNITAILDNLNPAKDKVYNYDSLYRLADTTGPWGNLDYSYDSVGNRTEETTDTGLTNYSYNANKLVSSTGEKTFNFDYDNTGNTTVENNRDYIYNQNQRLIEAVDNGITVGEYIYNGNNQRIKKTANGQTTIFHYSLSGQLIAESDDSGMVNAEYVYLFNQPLAKIENDDIYIYHNDHLGTPMIMTDEGGSVVWEGELMPFGEALSVTGSITNNLRFPGQYYDSETGLHYNWYRDYKPEVGRYMQFDPMLRGISKTEINTCRQSIYSFLLQTSQELNPFVYTENSPVNFIDPQGLVCGSKGFVDWIVPDKFPSYDFTTCCQDHDNCYGCKGKGEGLSKRECDQRFCDCLKDQCKKLYGYSKKSCEGNSKLYCEAVKKYGGNAFRNARKECCD